MRLIQLVRMAPWRRGPWLLLRRPGVVLALTAACFVATLPAASAPPFVSASRNGTLRDEIALTCPSTAGNQIRTDYTATPVRPAFKSDREYADALRLYNEDRTQHSGFYAALASRPEGLGAPQTTLLYTTGVDDSPTVANIVARPDFPANITVLSGPSGAGLWVPDIWAASEKLTVGSTVTLNRDPAGSENLKVRVAAIYRDLRTEPARPFWCAFRNFIGQNQPDKAVKPFILTDVDTFNRIDFGFGGNAFTQWPLANTEPTVEQAKRTVAAINRLDRIVGGIDASRDTAGDTQGTGVVHRSDIATLLPRADFAGDAIRPAITPIAGIGIGVGLALVAAAGVFWVLRRRVELTVLSAHGMSAWSLGAKAAIEALPALAVGAVAGWATAGWLVRTAGPSRFSSSAAQVESIEAAAAMFAAAVLVVAFVAGRRSRALADAPPERARLRLGRVPWELLLVAGAPVLWRRLGGALITAADSTTSSAGAVVHVPARLLIVPIIAIIGLLAFAGRLTTLALRARKTGSRGAMARYLAGRRIVREAAIAVVLALTVAVPVGLAMYGVAVNRSVQATLDAKAQLYVGTDVVISLARPVPIPASLAGQATEVYRTRTLVGPADVDVLGVDPDAFGRIAFWNDQITGASMADLVAPLRRPGALGTPNAVADGTTPDGTQTIDVSTRPLLFNVIHADMLPARHNNYDIMLVNADLMRGAPAATPQLWIRGDLADIRAKVAAAGLPVTFFASAADFNVHSVYEPLTFTFEYLTALSLLCGVVAVVGLLLYLEARAPGHRRSYVMLRRMGMPKAGHWRAMLWELGPPMLAGLAAGLGTAVVSAWTLRHNFDVEPGQPPGALLTLPGAAMAGVTVAVVVVAVVASAYGQVRVARVNPSTVLRDVL